MSDVQLRKWIVGLSSEVIDQAKQEKLSIITPEQVKCVLEAFKGPLATQENEIAVLKENPESEIVFFYPIGVVRPQILGLAMSEDGPVAIGSLVPNYPEMEDKLNGNPLASRVHAVNNPTRHNEVLVEILRLRQSVTIAQALEEKGDDHLMPIAEFDRSNDETKLSKLANNWFEDCKKILDAEEVRNKMRVANANVSEDKMRELWELEYKKYEQRYGNLDYASRRQTAVKLLETAFSNNSFVASFIESLSIEAEATGARFLPFFDLTKIGYTQSSNMILQGICLGAHLAEPNKIPAYVKLAQEIKLGHQSAGPQAKL